MTAPPPHAHARVHTHNGQKNEDVKELEQKVFLLNAVSQFYSSVSFIHSYLYHVSHLIDDSCPTTPEGSLQ